MRSNEPEKALLRAKLEGVTEFQLNYLNPERCCCYSAALSISANVENTAVATGLEKMSFHFNPREGQAKECSNCCAVGLILCASKVMLISIKLGLSSMWMENFQMYRPDLENTEESKVKLPAFTRSCRKQRNSRKASTTTSLTMMKPLTVWITANWKILKRDGSTRPLYLSPEKSVYGLRSRR